MHCDAEAGAPARAAGGERDEDGAAAAPARLRGDLRFRARVVGAAGVALCVSLCVQRPQPVKPGRREGLR